VEPYNRKPLKISKCFVDSNSHVSGENGPDANHQGILQEVKSYSDAGGQILFGTDIGYLTDYPLLTSEYALLGRAV
jgi:hypothetical protein